VATNAQFGAQPFIEVAQVSTANTNRDGTGTTVLLTSGPSTAAADGVGKRISRVWVARPGTSTNTIVTFFYSIDGGTTKRLISEWNIPAYTATTTSQQAIHYCMDLTGLVLPGSTGGQAVQLYAATTIATTLNICVESASL